MPIDASRERSLAVTLARAGARLGLAGLFMLGANDALQNASAEGDTRTLSFHHVHTGEDITDHLQAQRPLRRRRAEEARLVHARLAQGKVDAHGSASVRSVVGSLSRGRRNAADRRRLRLPLAGHQFNAARGARAALRSSANHINGQAMDFFIPGVPLEKIRDGRSAPAAWRRRLLSDLRLALRALDTGTIRHWPRMTHDQLVKVFPDGRTVHIPSDGHPLARLRACACRRRAARRQAIRNCRWRLRARQA